MWPALGIPTLAALMFLLLTGLWAGRDRHRWIAGLILGLLWFLSTGLLAWSGVLQRFDTTPPPVIVILGLLLVIAVAIGLSPVGKRFTHRGIAILLGVQSFRFPLELLMDQAATDAVMPVELSFRGYNLDIITGITAAALAMFIGLGVHIPTWMIWIWNLFGMTCLGVIVFVAVSSSPMIKLFGENPEHVNTWVLFLPYVWLPSVLVPIALFGHVVVTRKLMSPPNRA
ncbi:MAG: hypothetical protein RLN76_07800 [Phycisphaeraceae bacterium]